MPFDEPQPHLKDQGHRDPLTTFLTFVSGAILLVAGIMFSLLLVAVVAVVGLLALSIMWWKTRALRRHLREQMVQMRQEHEQGCARDAGPGEGVIIEGEVIREDPRLPP